MTAGKWQEIIGNIKDNFKVEETEKLRLEDEGGTEIEYIIFYGPLGKMKLEYISRPVVLDRKTKYSKRLAATTVVEYVYSPEEKTHKLKAYKWDEATDGWLELEAKNWE